jgi:hypothetical protein
MHLNHKYRQILEIHASLQAENAEAHTAVVLLGEAHAASEARNSN